MPKLKVGIDNYGLFPLGLDPFEVLQWARENGAEGVQFSGLTPEISKKIDKVLLRDLAQCADAHDLYLEWGGGQHIPFDMKTWRKKDIFSINRRAAEEAQVLGTRIVRSCSGGLMRWQENSPGTSDFLKEMVPSLRAQREMLKDHNVILAIETHFEFTTFELLHLFAECETEPYEYLGICLDTMNFFTMLEEPVAATQRILPWVVATHIKDGGLIESSQGLITFPAEIGKGVIALDSIIKLLAAQPENIHLSIEDHGGDFLLPVYDHKFITKFPDLTTGEYTGLLELEKKTRRLVAEGHLAVVKREDWPGVCEERLKRGIQALKGLVKATSF